MDNPIIVAIDGPAGAGKSTVARAVAERLGFLYVDSGAMYRAIALTAIENNLDPANADQIVPIAQSAEISLDGGRVVLNGRDISANIRRPEVSQAASRVSAIPGVRRELVAKQQQYATITSVVMEGRDIGTVVYPGAQVKIYLDATPDARAHRRVNQFGGDHAQVLNDIVERDHRDTTRADSPLRQADDAIYVDTSSLDEEGAILAILRIVRERTSNAMGVTS